jgi:hypothetical protein
MKNKATLLSLAIAGLVAAGTASAAVNLATGATATIWASEIIATPTAPLVIATGTNTTVTSTLGFGLSANQTTWIRYDLTNAKFAVATAVANLTDATTAGNIPGANIIIAQGGAVGDSFVVFQVTATAAGVPFTDVIQFAAPNLNLQGTAAPVTVKYTLHGTAASAGTATSAPNSAVLSTVGPANLMTFSTANNFSFSAAQTETIAAATQFLKFCTGAAGAPGTTGCIPTATDTDALVGTLKTYTFNGVLDATGTAIAALTTVNGATSKMTINGDFSAVASAYVDNTAGCVGTVKQISGAAAVVTATSATFTTGNTAWTVPAAICATVNGTSTIANVNAFTGTFNPVSAAAAVYAPAASAAVTTGTWARDGVELQAPWFTIGGTGSAYISRFFLTNTTANDVACAVVLMTEANSTVTAGATTSVTVPAGKVVTVNGTDIAANTAATPTASRAAARFVCAGPSGVSPNGLGLQGTYVLTHTNGAVSTGAMLRPGTN